MLRPLAAVIVLLAALRFGALAAGRVEQTSLRLEVDRGGATGKCGVRR